MKLRNKKTGEIIDIDIIENRKDGSWEWQAGKTLHDLAENWEDYKPTEPLIKDEKIRKAVRAWAEANSLKEIQYRSEELGDRFNGFVFEYIQFNPWKAYDLENYKIYTITELCGDEKE